MASQPFFDRLEAVRQERGSVLCVGIDPRLERIPADLKSDCGGEPEAVLRRFGLEILELAGPHAACFKPQIAFFEAYGLAGLRAYADIVKEARRRGHLVIADAKRGDIGSTAAAYAKGHLEPGTSFEVDAMTLNPYLGADALQPFVDAATAHGKGLYVLVRTSNPGAKDLQEYDTGDATRLFERTADLVKKLGDASISAESGLSAVGAVVGATAPDAAVKLRERMPSTPFLVPGYGAQGATASDVCASFRTDGSGAVVNASRSVIHPQLGPDEDWREAISRAARAAKEELHAAVAAS